jgi:predicted MPP superfamily phosphohydrolase
MRWLGDNPFHALLLLTEKPARWAAWQVAPVAAFMAAGAGWSWARATGQSVWGWVVALGLLVLAVADWALLAALPRWGVSYGAVQPPWLGLVILRGLLTLVAIASAARWLLPSFVLLLLVQVLIWALAAYGMLVEPFRLELTEFEIRTSKFSNPGAPLRIVQLSDLHVERLTRRERSLPGLVERLSPDLIVLTGDFLSTSFQRDPEAVSDLKALLAQLHARGGIYAVWGTAEVDLPDLLRPVLDELGIVVLEDRAIEVTVGDHRLWLLGLTCSHDPVADGRCLRTLLADLPPGAFTLLLYHMPDLMPQATALGADLYLAGHTHGGQWRVPGFGALLTSSRYWKRYEGGHYQEDKTHLYVSRGIGMEGFGTPRARFFCPPEVVSITLAGLEES